MIPGLLAWDCAQMITWYCSNTDQENRDKPQLRQGEWAAGKNTRVLLCSLSVIFST